MHSTFCYTLLIEATSKQISNNITYPHITPCLNQKCVLLLIAVVRSVMLHVVQRASNLLYNNAFNNVSFKQNIFCPWHVTSMFYCNFVKAKDTYNYVILILFETYNYVKLILFEKSQSL